MANQYIWHIHVMDAQVQHDNKSNVINRVHWTFEGFDPDTVVENPGSSEKIYHTINGITDFEYDSENFTEYDDLTKEQVIEWIKTQVNEADMIAACDEKINELKNPTDVKLHPNW